jgi:hypothetical protein
MAEKFTGPMRKHLKTEFGVNSSNPTRPTPYDPVSMLPSSATAQRNLPRISRSTGKSLSSLQKTFGATTNLDELTELRPSIAQVNPHVPVAKICASFENSALMNTQKRYLLLLTYKYTPDTTFNRKLTDQQKNRYQRYPLFDIIAWNYTIASTEPAPKDRNSVLSAKKFWGDWEVCGFVKTEQGESKYYREDNRNVSPERLFNISAYGFTKVAHVWGNKVRPGTKLYLILKKVPTPQEFIIDVYSSSSTSPLSEAARKGINVTPKPFQLSYWADHTLDYPPDSELIYYDEFEQEQRGIAIYIGKVLDIPEDNRNIRCNGNPATDARTVSLLPQIDIHFDHMQLTRLTD